MFEVPRSLNRRMPALYVWVFFFVIALGFTQINVNVFADAGDKASIPSVEAPAQRSASSAALANDVARSSGPTIGTRYSVSHTGHSGSAGFNTSDFGSMGQCGNINLGSPDVGDVYEVTSYSGIGFSSGMADFVSRLFRAYDDPSYSGYSSSDLDYAVQRAVWRATNGTSVSGLAAQIYSDAYHGHYQPQPVVYLYNVHNHNEQPIVILPGDVKDFGDAPQSYDEAYAYISDNISLGLTIDDEDSQQYSNSAEGDDNNGSDDEDGVDFLGTNAGIPGQENQISITVVNTQPNNDRVFVSGWIDFNGDGDFDDNEQIIDDDPVYPSNGPQKVFYTYTVPENAVPGMTYARFRVNDWSGTEPTGEAPGHEPYGEVEDYKVTIKELTGSIGDTVWLDLDGDGVQGPGEDGIEGVTVILTDENGNTTTVETDQNGEYLFQGVPEGTYTISIDPSTLPDDLQQTYDDDGLGTPNESTIDLAAGENNLDQDFGYEPLGSIGDTVWFDENGDGVQGPGEDGIQGVSVTLTDENGVQTTVQTGPDGDYLFEGLTSGDYTVTIDPSTLPAGYSQTYDDDGLGTPNESSLTLGVGEDNLDQDFGYELLEADISIIKTAGSTPDGDVLVIGAPTLVTFNYLVENTGETYLSDITITDDAGTPADPADDVTLTSAECPDLAGPLAPGGTVACSADIFVNGDATNVATTSGNPTDEDGNDIPGIDEPTDDDDAVVEYVPGVPGIQVIKTAGTAPNGEVLEINDPMDVTFTYEVTNIGATHLTDISITDDAGTPADPADDVTLTSAECPDLAGPLAPGGAVTCTAVIFVDGDAVNVATTTGNPTDENGNDLPGVDDPTDDDDAEVVVLGSIGDTVWFDNDGDGVQGLGEDGIPGVTVTLTDANGVSTSMMTDPDGMYLFENLPAGDYTITVDPATLPDNVVQTYDSDGLGTLNESEYTLGAGEDNVDQDFGYQPLGAIGDTVWFDEDGDGVQGLGEDGLPGVTVTLTDANGVSTSMMTDSDGMYLFENLPEGEYTITVDPATLPDGVQQSYDADGLGTPNESVYDLGAGQTNLDQDFGYEPLGSIGDTVWFDTNGDGVQGLDEDGISSVTVTLTDANGVSTSMMTDSDGMYLFDNLPAGDYTITVDPATLPDGVVQTYDFDSLGTPNVSEYTLGIGEDNLDQDFGYQYLGAIGDRVWFDDIDPVTGLPNGLIDANESGIADVEVVLWEDVDGDGQPDNVVDQTTTDPDGYYSFSGLAEGDYIVQIPPSEFLVGEPLFQLLSTTGNGVVAPDPDNDVEDDDNGNPAGALGTITAPVTIVYGSEPTNDDETGISVVEPDANSNKTVDLGFQALSDRVAVGGAVWVDNNTDGVMGSDEEMVVGVEVTLFQADGLTPAVHADGTLVEATFTNFEGKYSWNDLQEGVYVIHIAPVEGYALTPFHGGDPDVNPDPMDNNGIYCMPACGFARSGAVDVSQGTEPMSDGQTTGNDVDGNLTVGFGLVEGQPPTFTAVEMSGSNTTTGIAAVTVALLAVLMTAGTAVVIRRKS